MGAESASNSNSERRGGGNTIYETPVVLNVYDLTPANQYTVWFGLGIFHSGIEGIHLGNHNKWDQITVGAFSFRAAHVLSTVYIPIGEGSQIFDSFHGMEYGFGAHDFPVSGVFEVEPKSCPGFIFRCSIPLGHTSMPPYEFRTFIESVASEYHGNTYHLISKNCNHFTNDIAWRLTSKHIPGWVNRLARLGSVCSCLLPESLQVTTVKQLPEYHACAEEDGTESLSTTTRESTESDDANQDKLLLSPPARGSDVAFIKERPDGDSKLPA
ncbi:unnamed protein product [Camellia sinensis]